MANKPIVLGFLKITPVCGILPKHNTNKSRELLWGFLASILTRVIFASAETVLTESLDGQTLNIVFGEITVASFTFPLIP